MSGDAAPEGQILPSQVRLAVDATREVFRRGLEDIFERFLTRHLQRLLARHGLHGAGQLPHQLDEARRLTIRPDLTIRRHGRVAGVVDAKYTDLAGGKPSNEHIYQVMAYCTVLGLAHGHLVYAAGNPAVATHTVRAAGLAITAHALDLDQPPKRVEEQIAAISEWIVNPIAEKSEHAGDSPRCTYTLPRPTSHALEEH